MHVLIFAEQGRVIFFKDKKNGNFNEMQKAVFSLFIEQIQFDFFCSFPLHYVTARMPLWIPDFVSTAVNY